MFVKEMRSGTVLGNCHNITTRSSRRENNGIYGSGLPFPKYIGRIYERSLRCRFGHCGRGGCVNRQPFAGFKGSHFSTVI